MITWATALTNLSGDKISYFVRKSKKNNRDISPCSGKNDAAHSGFTVFGPSATRRPIVSPGSAPFAGGSKIRMSPMPRNIGPQCVRQRISSLSSASSEDTLARQCSNKFDIALAYSYLWLRRRYFASEKMQASLLFSLGLFVLWLTPKILPLGKMQVNLLLPSLIRIFGCVEDTSPRKKCKQACFFLSAYSYFG